MMNTFLALVCFLLAQLSLKAQSDLKHTPSLNPAPPPCPNCGSHHTVKNGSIHNGKAKRLCKQCGRHFVINPTNHPVSQDIKALIDKLLLERISLRGIARVTGVSLCWLQSYVNSKYASVPRQISVSDKPSGRLTIACDEMWSFICSKGNEFYIWLAIDRDTREIVGFYGGDRTRQSAQKLWNSLPAVYRQCAVAYTDFWQAYRTVIPSKRLRLWRSEALRAVGKETGQTNHIERLNNTLRQRISRLVRKSLSFSRKRENHIGAILYFIHDYNARLAIG